jgi:hypothetical protein
MGAHSVSKAFVQQANGIPAGSKIHLAIFLSLMSFG